jgi:acetylglutamate kinase
VRVNTAPMLVVLKYGGHAIAAAGADPVLDECAALWRRGDRIVLVHGGAPQIDAVLRERAITERRVAGLRVTDDATLAVVESVLCGTVNKALVRALLVRGVRVAGVSGQDAALLRARRATGPAGEDLGAVGEVDAVDPLVLRALLDAGLLPVVAPLAVDATAGRALNVNADTAAGAIAAALRADLYVNVTAVPRVRMDAADPATEVARLDGAAAARGIAAGAFDGGMRPKVRSALDALAGGAARAVIRGAAAATIAGALRGEGTEITA